MDTEAPSLGLEATVAIVRSRPQVCDELGEDRDLARPQAVESGARDLRRHPQLVRDLLDVIRPRDRRRQIIESDEATGDLLVDIALERPCALPVVLAFEVDELVRQRSAPLSLQERGSHADQGLAVRLPQPPLGEVGAVLDDDMRPVVREDAPRVVEAIGHAATVGAGSDRSVVSLGCTDQATPATV